MSYTSSSFFQAQPALQPCMSFCGSSGSQKLSKKKTDPERKFQASGNFSV